MQRVEERATVIQTKLLFFELEWAELSDERVEELLADERLTFARHHLRSERRYRPHLLTEPEEVILTEKALSGRSAWERLFEEQVSSISIELDGGTTTLEAALGRLHAPDRDVRRAAAEAVTAGLEPGLRTRAFVMNTLLPDKAVDDRLRHFDTWIQSRNLANEAGDASVQALVDAVQGRNSIAQRWYSLKARLLGIDRLADYDRMASVADVEAQIGWQSAKELVLDAYGSFSGELADTAQRFFDGAWIDARGPSGEATRCVLRVHRPVAPSVRAVELDVAAPRRAHARARARARVARVPGARAGDLPPGNPAHARGDRVGVR